MALQIPTVDLSSWLQWPSRTTAKHVFYGVLIGISLSLTSSSLALLYQTRKKEKQVRDLPPRPIELRSDEVVNGVAGLIGTYASWTAKPPHLLTVT